mgnify:CR=1 FL=1
MGPSTTTATSILPAALAAHGTLRLSYADDAMTSGCAEAINDRLVSVAAEDFARLAAAIGGFAEGTGIATQRGTKRVEDLVPGDRVVTRDAGVRSVRNTGRLHFGWRELGLLPVLRPVRLCRGTLGSESPTSDLVAAPSVRVLTGNGSQTAFEPLAHHAARCGGVTCPDLLEVRYRMSRGLRRSELRATAGRVGVLTQQAADARTCECDTTSGMQRGDVPRIMTRAGPKMVKKVLTFDGFRR